MYIAGYLPTGGTTQERTHLHSDVLVYRGDYADEYLPSNLPTEGTTQMRTYGGAHLQEHYTDKLLLEFDGHLPLLFSVATKVIT